MESPKKITKANLLEIIRKEVEISEKKKFLQNRICKINEELNFLIEDSKEGSPFDGDEDKDDVYPSGNSDWNKGKSKEGDIDEGLFQNVGKAIGRTFSGIGQAGKNIKQNFQQGSDQKKLQYITNDIQTKEKELANLKNQYKFLTTQNYKSKGAKNIAPVPRNQQGVLTTNQPIKKPIKNIGTIANPKIQNNRKVAQ